MLSIFKTQRSYHVLDDKDPEHGDSYYTDGSIRRLNTTSITQNSLMTVLVIIIAVSNAGLWWAFSGTWLSSATRSTDMPIVQTILPYHEHQCDAPVVRQEWRTLSEEQQLEYVTAVQCLSTKPSVLHPNASLYDDFPWVHKELSAQTHKRASFLPWHREFIRLYERTLKEECGMQGNIPYWDWSLDWADPSASPIWDEQAGFGGNGDPSGPETVGDGRCVASGPFSGLEPKYFDGQYHPHCLSRGFPSEAELQDLGKLIQPAAIETMIREPRYSAFEKDLEHRAHQFLSRSVRGDLSRFTGPNDPIFFLHHVNIDRIWWRWQQTGPQSRIFEYNNDGPGNGVAGMDGGVSLTDVMNMSGLGANVPVSHVMQTHTQRLCYTY